MFQPFERFEEIYIDRLIGIKRIYLVSQTYSRGVDHLDSISKTPILLSEYEDPGLAKIHLNAVKNDKYASIINMTNQQHRQKIMEMLAPNSKYTLFWCKVMKWKPIEDRLNARYPGNIRRYIASQTNWRISHGETVETSYEVTFGEFFIVLKRGNQSLRIKFEEIEKS